MCTSFISNQQYLITHPSPLTSSLQHLSPVRHAHSALPPPYPSSQHHSSEDRRARVLALYPAVSCMPSLRSTSPLWALPFFKLPSKLYRWVSCTRVLIFRRPAKVLLLWLSLWVLCCIFYGVLFGLACWREHFSRNEAISAQKALPTL